MLLDAVTIVQRDAGNIVIQNPSFEASGTPPAPGYISTNRISGWTGSGNYGVNFSGVGPFADNGRNPDQDNVAFIQGAGSLSQTISNLTAGQTYTLSYAYNARSGNTPHLTVTIGGTTVQDENITPVGGSAPYYGRSASFTAGGSTALLTFAQTATGDQTVLLDNVAICYGSAISDGNKHNHDNLPVVLAGGGGSELAGATDSPILEPIGSDSRTFSEGIISTTP